MRFSFSAVTIVLWIYSCGLSCWARGGPSNPGDLEKLWVGDITVPYYTCNFGLITPSRGPTHCVVDSEFEDRLTYWRWKRRWDLNDYAPLQMRTRNPYTCSSLMVWHPDTKFAIGKGWAYMRRPFKYTLDYTYTSDCVSQDGLLQQFRDCIREHGGRNESVWDTGECDYLATERLELCSPYWTCPDTPGCYTTLVGSTSLTTIPPTTVSPHWVPNQNTSLPRQPSMDHLAAFCHDLFGRETTTLSGDSTVEGGTTLWGDLFTNQTSTLSGDATVEGGTALWQDLFTNQTTKLSGNSTIEGNTTLLQDLLTNLTTALSGGSKINGSTTLAPDGFLKSDTIDKEEGQFHAFHSSETEGLRSLNKYGIGGLIVMLVAVVCIVGYVDRRRRVRKRPIKGNGDYNIVMGADPSDQSTGSVEHTLLPMVTSL